jgi:Amt family ammonium transporter
MGLIGGVGCFWAATSLKHIFGYDDSLDAFGVHGVGGAIGSVLTGVFAVSSVNPAAAIALTGTQTGAIGLLYGNSGQLVNQIKATVVTIVFAAVATFVILKIIDMFIGLRVSREEEFRGLDLSEHGEAGYNLDEL